MMMSDTKRQMLRDMYRIRLFEERLKQFYDYTGFYGDGTIDGDAQTVEEMLTCVMYDFEKSGMIGGAVHLYIGEEAVAIGVCTHLRDTDNITSYHRGHGHALAKGLEFPGMMAELMGRETGYSRGFGGSMHIFDRERGMLGGNGIVGAQIPLALGPAFAAKYRGEDGVAVAFFGDGAANQGTLAEAMNIAAVWQLPIVFVCENNLWAASTPANITHATEDIAPRAEGYDIPWAIVDGMDVMAVHEAAGEAVSRARSGGGPTFIETKTYRFESHAGGGRGTHQDPETLETWQPRDPICQFEARLIAEGVMTAEEQTALREELAAELELAVEAATDSPFAEAEELGASYLPSTHSTKIEVRETAGSDRSAKRCGRRWRATTACSSSARTSGLSASARDSGSNCASAASSRRRSPRRDSWAWRPARRRSGCGRSSRSCTATSSPSASTRSSTRPRNSSSCPATASTCRWSSRRPPARAPARAGITPAPMRRGSCTRRG
jgi:pyruvate dehydrogenase E1 component alpha subunit